MAYCTQTDMENLYGTDNVKKWSNLSGTTDEVDATRLARSIVVADDEIDSRLRNSAYAVPFTSPPVMVVNWSATLATWWLYKARGRRDTPEYDRMRQDRDDVLEQLEQVTAGVIEIDAAKSTGSDPTAMTVET